MSKAPAIGIDLGTTYSCVGYFRDDHVRIIHNEIGLTTTASYVSFTSYEHLVGDSAKSKSVTNPENTIYDVKRLIGRKFNDETVQEDMKNWPFQVVNVNGNPRIKVTHKGKKKIFSPEMISSMVLSKMKQIAETHLRETVTDAVITVPAYFNDAQRRGTKDAAQIAGLNVLGIISEPTAAGIAYALNEKMPKVQNILIYDLGGGTFDVSIMKVIDGKYDVVTTAGDTHLGGEDFDTCMVNHFKEVFRREHRIDLSNYPKAIRRLRIACERAKRTLSHTSHATIESDSLCEGIDFIKDISKGLFEKLCIDLFNKTLLSVNEALQAARMDKKQIDEVVLVGGSTRIPKVQNLLSEYFNGKRLNLTLHPDEAVAYGAAIEAAILSGEKSEKIGVVITDVTTYSLGLECEGEVFASVIKRNTPTPVKVSSEFSNAVDNATSADFLVYEGEHPVSSRNHLLGRFTLNNTRKAPRGQVKFNVTFEIDRNGILTVSATENGTNNSKQITITNSTGYLSTEELTRQIREARQMNADASLQRILAEAQSVLEGL